MNNNDNRPAMGEGQSNGGPKFDIEERVARFGEEIIQLCKGIKRGPINDPLVNQLVRAATSVGANYCEANNAESRRDFRHKIAICRKESKECCFWLRMLAKALPEKRMELRPLWKESDEINRIFASIYRKTTV